MLEVLVAYVCMCLCLTFDEQILVLGPLLTMYIYTVGSVNMLLVENSLFVYIYIYLTINLH